MTPLMTLLALMAGLILALQGPVNSAIGTRTNVWIGTTISFTGGVVALIVLVLLLGQGDLSQISSAEPWQLVGGLYGIVSVSVTIAVMPKLGAALSLMAIMLGQLSMGALIDEFGWFGASRKEVTPLRIIGILIIAVGIVVVYRASLKSGGDRSSHGSKAVPNSFLLLIAFLSGAAMAMQSPTNASLAGIVGSLEGTLISFAVGAVGSWIILLVYFLAKREALPSFSNKGIKPWMLFGGLFGVVGIFLNLYTVTAIGAALQAASGMVGQLLGGIIIDTTGLCSSPRVKVTKLRIAGILIITAGVVVTGIAGM